MPIERPIAFGVGIIPMLTPIDAFNNLLTYINIGIETIRPSIIAGIT